MTCSPQPCYVSSANFFGDTITKYGLFAQRTANGYSNLPANTVAGLNNTVAATVSNYSNIARSLGLGG